MNNEIKEILKEIECYKNEEMCIIVLSQKENNALLDYITNLQKENEKLRMRNDMLRKDIDSFIQDNKIDYKSRVEKAIEYINNFWREKNYYKSVENCLKFATMNEFEKEDLLNILQNGSDKE